MAEGTEPGTIKIAEGGWLEWLRLDDDGITVRNFVQAYRIGWHEVRRFEDGSESGRRGRHWWALRIVLRDGRVIIADGTSSLQTAARPQALAAIRRAAERHEIPAALTGMPPATGPGVITIADSDGWAWLRFDDDGITVRNPFRTYRVGWDEVCCFTDGQAPLRGHHWWALRIVLRDGRGITAIGTSGRGGTARPGTLAAIRQAASRHEIPAVFTGKRVGSRATKAAAQLTDTKDSTASPLDDHRHDSAPRVPTAGQSAAAADTATRAAVRIRCPECGMDSTEATQVCVRCGAPLSPLIRP